MIRTQTRTSVYSENDPLSLVLKPPSSETDEERRVRVRTEQEAKIQSDKIDEQIKAEEREMQRRRKSEIKVSRMRAKRCWFSIGGRVHRLFLFARVVHTRVRHCDHPPTATDRKGKGGGGVVANLLRRSRIDDETFHADVPR